MNNLFYRYTLPILNITLWLLLSTGPVHAQMDLGELFALDGNKNLMLEENFGIINGRVTTRVHHQDVGTISGLYAPPYASSDFLLEMTLFGERVQTTGYRWYPYKVIREGEVNGVAVTSNTVLTADHRAGLLRMTFHNQTGVAVVMPIQFHIRGGLNYTDKWEFARPKGDRKTQNTVTSSNMTKSNTEGSIILSSDIPDMVWFELGSRWDTKIMLGAGETASYHLAFEIGAPNMKGEAVSDILNDPERAINDARDRYTNQVKDIFTALPRFSALDKRLENYYNRSLVTLITNSWQVPEFILQPYYGSGGVIGGCVGNYLWEFGLPAQLFPLFDAKGSADHIKQFLKVDMTKHYLFNPMTGGGGGVWYQVNQDKIVELIYYHVLHTGNAAFLNDVVAGRTVYDHLLENALFGDDLSKPVTLVDYGADGENHLELRRGYPYRGVMPDVNALRYLTYIRTYELSQLVGRPMAGLLERAASLKRLLKDELWSEEHQWFYFKHEGGKDIRWTNFMYTLVGTGVFDENVEQGLLSHLNEQKFLGEYGIHSISKHDPAYDQVDIDHGGGGSYMAFPPLICQRFYNAGYAKEADDLLQRHLWWGEHLPYWGDSKVANYMGYREDTPLQSDFDSITGAQTFIFGLFGLKVTWDGTITVNPIAPSFSPEIKLEGLKIRGKTIDINVNASGYSITVDGKHQHAPLGTLTTII